MTDASDPAPDTSAIVQRRLIGLVVLLIVAFVLSLLLRARPNAPDQLPSVVISLNGSSPASDAALSASAAPMLDEPEPLARPPAGSAPPAPTESEKPAATKSAEVTKTPAITPKPKPVTGTPAAPVTSKPPSAAAKPAPASKPEAGARWFVAVGAYKDPMAAQAIVSRVKQAGFGASAVAITSGGEQLHRVRAGPFSSKDDAESARATLIVEGLTKAATVSEK